jgi:Flp pilus assembly protein TadG
MRQRQADRGAAAVEFALIVPLLLVVLFAIIDLGWVFNQQLSVTAAAREGARYFAVHTADSGAQAVAEDLVVDLLSQTPTITYESTCSDDATDDKLTMVVEIPLTDLTGWLAVIAPDDATLRGVGSMRCGG